MEFRIKRMYFGDTYTIGALQYRMNSEELYTYLCDTLEPHAIDWSKDIKLKGKTAIPEGTYNIVFRPSRRFGKMMQYFLGVPEFSGVMIHAGNLPDDTQGCILVGRNNAKGQVTDSLAHFKKLYSLMVDANEPITLEVRSPKRWTYKRAQWKNHGETHK